MRSYKCLHDKCGQEFDSKEEMTRCPVCGYRELKRLWCRAISMNGHGANNDFRGR